MSGSGVRTGMEIPVIKMPLKSIPEGLTADSTASCAGGGSWFSGALSCRSAARYGLIPSYRDGYNGFRAVVSIK